MLLRTVPSPSLIHSCSAHPISTLAGDIPVAANNPVEQLLAVFWMLAGGIVWGFVIATLLNIANNSDPAQFEFRQAIEELNGFMRSHALPPELRMTLREYFYEAKFLTTHRNQMALIQNLSPKLLEETAVRSYVDNSPLSTLSFLKGVEKGFLAQVGLSINYVIYPPTEWVPAGALHILVRGRVRYMGYELSKDMVWGDDCVLVSNSKWRVGVRAQAIAYVCIGSILPEQLTNMALERGYLIAYRSLRRHAGMIALRRYLIKTSAQARLTKAVAMLTQTLAEHESAGGAMRLSHVMAAGVITAVGGNHTGTQGEGRALHLAAMAIKAKEDAKKVEAKGGDATAQDKKRKGWGVNKKSTKEKSSGNAAAAGAAASAVGGGTSGGSSGGSSSGPANSPADDSGGSKRGIKWANDVDFTLTKQQPQVEDKVEDDEEEPNAPLSGLGAFLGFGSARENMRENGNLGAGAVGLGALPPSIPLPATPSRVLPPPPGGVNDRAAFDLLQEINRRLAQQQGQIDKLCKRLDTKDAASRAGSADESPALTA